MPNHGKPRQHRRPLNIAKCLLCGGVLRGRAPCRNPECLAWVPTAAQARDLAAGKITTK